MAKINSSKRVLLKTTNELSLIAAERKLKKLNLKKEEMKEMWGKAREFNDKNVSFPINPHTLKEDESISKDIDPLLIPIFIFTEKKFLKICSREEELERKIRNLQKSIEEANRTWDKKELTRKIKRGFI